jgi:hypothetical protein
LYDPAPWEAYFTSANSGVYVPPDQVNPSATTIGSVYVNFDAVRLENVYTYYDTNGQVIHTQRVRWVPESTSPLFSTSAWSELPYVRLDNGPVTFTGTTEWDDMPDYLKDLIMPPRHKEAPEPELLPSDKDIDFLYGKDEES